MQKKLLFFSCLFLLAGCATNPPMMPNQPSSFAVRSELGRALMDLENRQPERGFSVHLLTRKGGDYLRVGDIFDIDMRSSKNAFLSLYLFQKSGAVVALTENLYARGGEKISFPLRGSSFRLKAQPPTGNNTLLLLATKQPIQGTIHHDNRYLPNPSRIVATQLGAIGVIKSQLRHLRANEWQSTVLDVPVYP